MGCASSLTDHHAPRSGHVRPRCRLPRGDTATHQDPRAEHSRRSAWMTRSAGASFSAQASIGSCRTPLPVRWHRPDLARPAMYACVFRRTSGGCTSALIVYVKRPLDFSQVPVIDEVMREHPSSGSDSAVKTARRVGSRLRQVQRCRVFSEEWACFLRDPSVDDELIKVLGAAVVGEMSNSQVQPGSRGDPTQTARQRRGTHLGHTVLTLQEDCRGRPSRPRFVTVVRR